MPIAPPVERNWWDLPIGAYEKIWLSLVVVVGLGLFIMMPVWHIFGSQNPPTTTYRVSPEGYSQRVTEWSQSLKKVEQGLQPPGQEVYLVALKYTWFPNPLVLEAGVPYRIHLSSKDVQHGFSVHKEGETLQKLNFQVVPGYEHVLTMRFTEPGTYNLVCQEYCGIGHQGMTGKFIVLGGK